MTFRRGWLFITNRWGSGPSFLPLLPSFLELWVRERFDVEVTALDPGCTWSHGLLCYSHMRVWLWVLPPLTPQQEVARAEKGGERARVWPVKSTSSFSCDGAENCFRTLPSPQTQGAGSATGLWALP